MRQTKILVIGFPRSGTSFLHNLLVDSLGGTELTAKIHWEYQLANHDSPTVIHTVRDPRDVAVSGYFFYLGTFGHLHDQNFSNFKLLDFLKSAFSSGFEGGWPCGWREHTEHWLSKDVIHTQYERLMQNRQSELSRMLLCLGIETDTARVQYAVQQSYVVGWNRPPYVHKKGWQNAPKTAHPTVGEWKNHFGQQEIEFVQDHCGHLMERLGYD